MSERKNECHTTVRNFLKRFLKKVSTFFEPKILENPKKFSAKFPFKFFLKTFFDEKF